MSNLSAEIPREKLKQLVEKNGESLLNDPDRCEGLLKDHCGAHRKEISALVGALEERVPLELRSSWQTAMTPEAMRARLVQRLEENRGLAPEIATWAVDAWSYALGVGLARRSDRVDDPGSVVLEPENKDKRSVEERIASDRAGGGGAIDKNGAGGATKSGLNQQKKAGIGVAAVLAAAVGAYAMLHHPTPPPPQPQHGQDGGNGGNNGGNAGGNNGGNAGGNSDGKNSGGNGGNSGVNRDGGSSTGRLDGKGSDTGKRGGSGGSNGGGKDDGAFGAQSFPDKIPMGTNIPVRLDQAVNSDTLNEGDMLDATVSSPVTVGGQVVIKTGAPAHLRVVSIDHGDSTKAQQHLHLALADATSISGRPLSVSTSTHDFAGPTVKGDAVKRAGVGGAIGAAGGFVVGHLFHHGGTGAAAGAGTGAVAGAVTAKAGPVKLPAETAISFQLTRAATTRGAGSVAAN